MVKLIVKRLEGSGDIRKISDPPRPGINRSFYVDFNTKRMAVQLGTFMPGRYIRQPVRGIDMKHFEYFHSILPTLFPTSYASAS
jgi:hypothetical protein